MDARPSSTIELRRDSYGREIELARAVVTQVSRGGSSGLQAIRPHDLMRPAMLDDEVVANGIEFIGIVAVFVRRFEALPQFKIKYEKAQPVGRFEVLQGFGKAQPIDSCGQAQAVPCRVLLRCPKFAAL